MNEQPEGKRIRLLLLDRRALFRSSLARLLAAEPGLEVVAECGQTSEAVQLLSAFPVDVVLLDLDHAVDGADGLMSTVRRNGYEGQFLVLAEVANARNSAYAIQLGASGIFLKSEAPARLLEAIKLVANGAVWLDQEIIRVLADQSIDRLAPPGEQRPSSGLSDRERRVLLGVLGGLTNKKIAENLGVSEGTVKASIQQLFYRTGVRTRSQLVRAALEGSLGAAEEFTRRGRGGSGKDAARNPSQQNAAVRGLSA